MPFADNQGTNAFAGVNLVPGESVGIHAQLVKVKGYTQESLHTVHMHGSFGAQSLLQPHNFLNRLNGACLVIDLHDANETNILPQHGFNLCKIRHTSMIHRDVFHRIAKPFRFLCTVQHGRMLHVQNQYPSRLMQAAQITADGDIIRLRAAGGENKPLSGGAGRLQAGFSRRRKLLFRLHGRAVKCRRIVPFLRQCLGHNLHHSRCRLGGGTVVQIYFHHLSCNAP